MMGGYEPMRRAMMVAVALSCFVAAEATAAGLKRPSFFDGAKLGEACNVSTGFDAGLCFGYVFGVADLLETHQFVKGQRIWCWPDELTMDQAMDESVGAVQRYLRDHPETSDWSGSAVVWEALKEKFPCSGQ
jgi:hypothetical protein